MFRHVFMQTAAFAAQDDSCGFAEVHLVVEVLAALIQSVDPVTVLFQFVERAVYIDDPDHRYVGQGAGGRAGNGLGQPRRAPFRNQNRSGAGGMGGADHRPQVVRVFNPVQHHVQAAGGRGFLERGVTLGGAKRDHPLMRRTASRAVQLLARLEAYRNFALAAQVDHFLDSRTGGAFGDHHAIDGPCGLERLPDGMDSCKRRHYDKGTLMSAPENAAVETAYEIPDKLYFRIGEVARLAGIKPYVLRFWETEFPSLGPRKSGTGHRLYRRKEVELVLEIKRLLYEKRFTIEGARKFLETRAKPEPASAGKPAKPATVQAALFTDPSGVFDVVRKELRAIADLLK